MGIERFFSSINKNFDVVSELNRSRKIKTNVFLIDFNSIIHYVSSKIVSELNKKNSNNNFSNDIETDIIFGVKNYLNDLISNVDCNLIYIALDGVPTFSKILEQKKRRFIGDLIEELAKDYSLPHSFNKSLISPGTKFMRKVCDYLNNEKFPIETIISDTDDTGEGEFKILDYIYKNNVDDYIIYSPDADLIILSMITWTKNINSKAKILRFDQNTEILNVIYINSLIKYFNYYFEERVKNKIDTDKYIKDLCFVFTVFGNDFVPRIEEINVSIDLYLILDAYIINYVDNEYILDNSNRIIPKSFHNYISFLNKFSKTLEKRTYFQYKYHNFNYATTINLYLDIQNKKVNPYYRFYLDFIDHFDFNNKYGKLQYYLYTDEELIDLLDKYTFKNNFNQNWIEPKLHYQKFIPYDYSSKSKKHLIAMKDLSLRDKEIYMINNKLDNYYDLFMPNQKEHNNSKEMVNEYLKGLSWLTNYYFNSKADETWYYKFHNSPSLNNIYNYFNHSLLNFEFKDVLLNITPLEQALYITPIKQNNIDSFIETLDPKYFTKSVTKQTVKNFIESNMNLFYNLDELYLGLKSKNLKKNLMDCSSAIFISKCHYFILDHIQPINKFKLF